MCYKKQQANHKSDFCKRVLQESIKEDKGKDKKKYMSSSHRLQASLY